LRLLLQNVKGFTFLGHTVVAPVKPVRSLSSTAEAHRIGVRINRGGSFKQEPIPSRGCPKAVRSPSGVGGGDLEKLILVHFGGIRNHHSLVHNTVFTNAFAVVLGMPVLGHVELKSQQWRPKPEQVGPSLPLATPHFARGQQRCGLWLPVYCIAT